MRRALSSILFAGSLALLGCTEQAEESSDAATAAVEPAAESIVVFAAYEDSGYLPTLFNEFTQETGIVVIVRNGEIPGIVDDVIRNDTDPVADVLITPSVYDAWRVAEEGELRPNYSELVSSNVPEWLRDPDKYWLALGYRQAEIIYNADQFDAAEIASYEDLAQEFDRRKLCLSSSSLAINRTVIAMLMRKLGRREAELAVRGWVANFAQPPLGTEAELVQAIARGECGVGIASSGAAAGTRLQVVVPVEAYVDIEAIGVTRHAASPDAAIRLIDWLVSPEQQKSHAEQTGLIAVAGDGPDRANVVLAAAGAVEANKLAERARYR